MSRIDFIGTGNAFAPPGRLHACLCIDRNILVDLPPTVMPQLRSMGLDASDINHVLITHWHGDHTFGIPFFMLDRRYISDRLNECDLTIHLRPGGQSILTNLCEIGFPGDLGRFIKDQFEWETSESLSLGDWLELCKIPCSSYSRNRSPWVCVNSQEWVQTIALRRFWTM